jgi:hypothetical protein
VRVGSKYKRKYDKAKTAYMRVMENQDVSQEIKDGLTLEHHQLNPLVLKKKIDMKIDEIFRLNRLLREPNQDVQG